MSVLSVGSSSYDATAAVSASKAVTASDTQSASQSSASSAREPDLDTYVKSSEAQQTEYKRLDSDQISALKAEQSASFNKMISNILNNQINAANKASYAQNGITGDLFKNLTVTPEQKLAAQQAVSEDGEWGVNAVATRIIDLCVSLSGGDADLIEEMRAAVDKGFEQATGQWGGSLPGITGKTHDEINKRFDYWAENGSIDGYTYQKSAVA